MKVKDLMTKNVISLKPKDTLKDAAKLMYEHNIGIVPIVDNENYPVGVVTDRDIVIRGIAQNHHEKKHLEDIMSTNLITVNPNDKIAYATDLMGERQIRRLLVVNSEGKLVGILALADISTTEENDEKAKEALSQISLRSTDKGSNSYYGVEVDDFRL